MSNLTWRSSLRWLSLISIMLSAAFFVVTLYIPSAASVTPPVGTGRPAPLQTGDGVMLASMLCLALFVVLLLLAELPWRWVSATLAIVVAECSAVAVVQYEGTASALGVACAVVAAVTPVWGLLRLLRAEGAWTTEEAPR